MSESNEPLVVEIDLRESDLQRANLWFAFKGWSERLTWVVLPIAGLLLLARVNFSAILETPFSAIGAVVLLGFPIFYFVSNRIKTRQAFRNLKPFQLNVRYSFLSEGYKVSDLKSSAETSWDAILRVVESKHAFHLFFSKLFFHVIPKRCFKTPEDIGRMRTLLKERFGAKADLR